MLVLASIWTILLSTLFVIVAAMMVLVILVQKPKGGGLAGAFGGGGGGDTQSMFGARAGDVLTWITVGFFVVFLLLAIGLVFAARADAESADAGAPIEQREPVSLPDEPGGAAAPTGEGEGGASGGGGADADADRTPDESTPAE